MFKCAQILGAVCFLATAVAGEAFAQAKQEPHPDVIIKNLPPTTKQHKPFILAQDLDGLFSQLKRTANPKRAKSISTRIWEKWQTSDSKSVDLLTQWAREASGENRFGQALDLLDQVIVLRPDYAEGYNQRATLYFHLKDYGKSAADIERTLSLEPRHYGALAGLASIFEILGQKQKALTTWHRALNIYPASRSSQKALMRLEEALAGNKI